MIFMIISMATKYPVLAVDKLKRYSMTEDLNKASVKDGVQRGKAEIRLTFDFDSN